MAESVPSFRGVSKSAPAPAAPLSTWTAPLMQAATAFRDSYAEHLNHHCAVCTKAWADLNAALDAIPKP